MRLWGKQRRQLGSAVIRADRVLWMIAEVEKGRWSAVDGGVIPFDSTSGPEPAVLSELWERHRAEWGLVVPCYSHSGLFTLPPLEPSELAQGLQWQIQKAFSIDTDSNQLDYELLSPGGTIASKAKPAVIPNALLVALPKTELAQWIEWAGQLPYPPQRLEPTLAPLFRSIRSTDEFRESPGAVWVHRDLGGTAMIVTASGQAIGMRELGPEHGTEVDPLLDPGTPRLRELLLQCEDHYPELEIEHLIGLGDQDDDHLFAVARELGLSGQRGIQGPACPEPLLEDDGWLIPHGHLLEVAPHA